MNFHFLPQVITFSASTGVSVVGFSGFSHSRVEAASLGGGQKVTTMEIKDPFAKDPRKDFCRSPDCVPPVEHWRKVSVDSQNPPKLLQPHHHICKEDFLRVAGNGMTELYL